MLEKLTMVAYCLVDWQNKTFNVYSYSRTAFDIHLKCRDRSKLRIYQIN